MWDTIEWISWASGIGLLVAAYLVVRFVIGPRGRLPRVLRDGTAAGLRRADAAERDGLRDFLRGQLGGLDRKVELGAVYRTRDGDGYVFEMALARQESLGGSITWRYDRSTRLLLLGPTRIRRAFLVKPRSVLNVTGATRLALAEELGLIFTEPAVELLDGFRRLYSVHSAAPGAERVPTGVQEMFLRQAELSDPVPPLWLFDTAEAVVAPDFVALHLGRPPKRIAEVRAALAFARELRGEVEPADEPIKARPRPPSPKRRRPRG